MKFNIKLFLGLFISLSSYASYLTPSINLQMLKDDIIQYHESGAYNFDVKKITDQAKAYLETEVAKNKLVYKPLNLAIILDIDETSLSNYKSSKEFSFGGSEKNYAKAFLRADAPAIRPTLDLYKYAIKNDVTVFFITGRSEQFRDATIKNLTNIGYTTTKNQTQNCESQKVSDSCFVYFRDGKYLKTSAIKYKTAMRKRISDAGYTIVENIGDQYSDLDGGYSLKTFKYPNYIYYIP